MMIEEFLTYMRYERNKSPLTTFNYGRDLREFDSFLKQLDNHLAVETADSDLVRDWMGHLMEKGNSPTSINRKLSALRSFYRFALARGYVQKDPAHAVKGPKNERPLPLFLRENEMDRLIDDVEWSDTFKDVRARTLLIMFYETGIRVAEMVKMDTKDIDRVNRTIHVTGKGDKQRMVPYGDELAQALDDYTRKRNEEVATLSDALFVTPKGARLNTDQVRYIVKKKLSMVSSLKKKSPHVLRHTFATAMLNNGAGIESIQKLLGHAKVDTTEVYTHTTFEQLKRVYKQAHPRA